MRLRKGVYGNCKKVCTDSWLWKKKIPCRTRVIEPSSAACRSDALPAELHPHASPPFVNLIRILPPVPRGRVPRTHKLSSPFLRILSCQRLSLLINHDIILCGVTGLKTRTSFHPFSRDPKLIVQVPDTSSTKSSDTCHTGVHVQRVAKALRCYHSSQDTCMLMTRFESLSVLIYKVFLPSVLCNCRGRLGRSIR